ADTLRYNRSTYQRPTVRCSNPSNNASTARTPAQFPKSSRPADNREPAEKLCRPIVQQSYPTVPTIPRLPLSNRTSSNGSNDSRNALDENWLGAESNRRHVRS